jgi:23S rRNA pseudouridine1911/1915/1917 synthase
VTVPEAGGGRLDRVLAAQVPALSRSRLKALILAGQVAIEGRTVRDPAIAVNSGDVITVTLPEPEPAKPAPEEIPLDIVYEDDALIVLNKPAGLVVHPAAGHASGTLVNALIAHCGDSLSGIGGVRRPGIVHRLDKDASGLLVIARTQRAFDSLKAQFQAHTVKKEYAVLVDGGPPQDEGTITLSVGRKKGDGKMAARHEAKEGDRDAITHYSVDERHARAALLTIRTETGRTHQIRVHMNAIGCPVVGDELYGARKEGRVKSSRLFLHAKSLAFAHPATGERLAFSSPLPPALATVLDAVRGRDIKDA